MLAGDTDADGDTLDHHPRQRSSHGSVTCTSTLCTYTPDPGFFGTDSFVYTIHDGFGGCDDGAVTVTVDPRPIAASLAPATATTGPGATSINLADIPYERMREARRRRVERTVDAAFTVHAALAIHETFAIHAGARRSPISLPSCGARRS